MLLFYMGTDTEGSFKIINAVEFGNLPKLPRPFGDKTGLTDMAILGA